MSITKEKILNNFLEDCICGVVVGDLISDKEIIYTEQEIRKKFNIKDITYTYINEDEELEIIHRNRNYIFIPM